MQMDRLAEQNAAQFDLEFAAPLDGVIIGSPCPMGFAARNKGFSGQPVIHQMFRFLETGSPTILENRHQRAFGGFERFGQRVAIFQRADQRLFADHMFSCCQGFQALLQMQRGRGADINDIDIIHL